MLISLSENYFLELLAAIKNEFLDQIKIGDIGEQIRHAIGYNEIFSVTIGEYTFPFNQTTVGAWIAIAFVAIMSIYLTRDFKEIPNRKQIVTEGIVNIFVSLCRSNGLNKKQTQRVAPFVGSLAIFITFTNLTSMLKLAPPSKDPVFPITLAIFTVIYVIFTGISMVGIKGFWGSLTYPMPALAPFKILDYFIKPISLSLRLFGNVFGAFILMDFIFIIIPILIPGVIGIWFDLADGILQGAVFSYLSIVYIGEIVESAHNCEELKKAKKQEKLLKLKKASKENI